MRKSQFPHEEEKKLRRTFSWASKTLLQKYKALVKQDSLEDLPELVFSNEEKKRIIKQLTEVAISTNKQVFQSWRTLTDEELKRTDLQGAKYWIRQNYLRVQEMSKAFPSQMETFKEKKYKEILQSFNAPLDKRFQKMLDGKISKTDVNKLLTELKGYYSPSSEMKNLIEKLEKNRMLGEQDVQKLHEWANRRNELWARNETGNLYATQLEELCLENGIEKYIWRTMQDDRVRMEHIEYDGKVFNVGDGIFPGQDFGCRCWAEPVK